jgi:DNA-binding response OmpR family regulator
MARTILVVEDEPQIASLLTDYLSIAGFEAKTLADGRDALAAALSGEFDLVLLDAMLPGMDGFEILARMRESCETPVIMLTALREDADKVRGLGLGADDYVTKPFSPSELVARVRNRLDRYARLTNLTTGPEAEPGRWMADGDVEINVASKRARCRGAEVTLTAKEFELLVAFMRNPDRVFTKDDLYAKVWGSDHFGDVSTVAVHIRRLREKIERDPANPSRIETVWGMGYRWKLP